MHIRPAAAFACLLLAGSGICGAAPAPARTPRDLVLCLPGSPAAYHAGVFVAADRGLCPNVRFSHTPDQASALAAVVGGRADAAVVSLPTASRSPEHFSSLVLLTCAFPTGTVCYVVREDTGVRTMGDLRGRTVGIAYAGDETLNRRVLEKAGVPPDTVATVAVARPVRHAGANTPGIWIGRLYREPMDALEEGLSPLTLSFADLGVPLPDGLLVARREAFRTDPSAFILLARAVLAGWTAVRDDPDAGALAVLRRTRERTFEYQKNSVLTFHSLLRAHPPGISADEWSAAGGPFPQAITAPLSPLPDGPAPAAVRFFGSGPAGGAYFQLAERLAAAFPAADGGAPTVIPTGGSEANIHLVARGLCRFGLATDDLIAENERGAGRFAGGDLRPVRRLRPLYVRTAQLLVRTDGSVSSWRDLAGRRVSVGSPDGAAVPLFGALLESAGLSWAAVRVEFLGTEESCSALAAGRLDAVFALGARIPGFARLLSAGGARLLPVEEAMAADLAARVPGFLPYALPASAYKGLAQPLPAVGVPLRVIGAPGMPDAEAAAVNAALGAADTDAFSADLLPVRPETPKGSPPKPAGESGEESGAAARTLAAFIASVADALRAAVATPEAEGGIPGLRARFPEIRDLRIEPAAPDAAPQETAVVRKDGGQTVSVAVSVAVPGSPSRRLTAAVPLPALMRKCAGDGVWAIDGKGAILFSPILPAGRPLAAHYVLSTNAEFPAVFHRILNSEAGGTASYTSVYGTRRRCAWQKIRVGGEVVTILSGVFPVG